MKVVAGISNRFTVRTTVVASGSEAIAPFGRRSLISRLPQSEVVAWLRHGEGLVGWGSATSLVLNGRDRFDRAREWLADVFGGASTEDAAGVPGSGPVAFGSFSFDSASASTSSVLIVPRVIFGRRDGLTWRTTIGDRTEPAVRPRPAVVPSGVRWADGEVDAARNLRAVAAAVKHIRTGTLSKVVLARDLVAVADTPIDTRVLLHRLADLSPSGYTFACAGLVGSTPELLVRRMGGDIESLVLAGTAVDEPGNESAGAKLLSSAKDREEHAYAADMVRATLAPMCDELVAPRGPELLCLSKLIHLATSIRGRLTQEHSVLDIVEALHPTPAVAGYPTDTALDVIRELEVMDRGRYAGPVGWIDANGDGEWGIALRCAQIEGNKARLYAGGGIVGASDPATELSETQAKFEVMRRAIEG